MFKKQKSFLGVDIGSTSIKLVELTKKGNIPYLVTYGYGDRKLSDLAKNDSSEITHKTAAFLKEIYKKAGATSYQASTALPNFSVFTSVIVLPVMSEKDLVQAIQWEAKKIIPMALEDVVLDWKIVETIKTETKKNYRILLTVASKKLVERYVELFKKADLQLLSLETESFALSRSLLSKDEEVAMIIDSSALTTDVIIFEKGIPILNRSIDVGGLTITKSIANCLNIDFHRAEQFKRDIDILGNTKVPQIIQDILKPVVDEVKYSLNLYQSQTGKTVTKAILSGGSSYLPNFDTFLSQNLGIKVFIGNPWDRIAYPQELEPVLTEIAPRFSVAIGLALREID